MENDKCLTCSENQNCKDSFTSWIFFIIGIIATLAVRVVTVLIHVDPVYGKIAWYVGIGGFLAFFIYKFKVNQTRARHIMAQNLTGKINRKQKLTEKDYNILGAVLCSLSSNKERINYFVIFVLSGLALILALYMDFIR